MAASGSPAAGWALCVVTARTPRCDHLDCVRAAIAGGAPLVQLRVKEGSDADLRPLAERARALTRAAGVRLIVNDRVDLALAVGADGVHLGPDDEPWAAARQRAPSLCIGASVSNRAETSQALAAGVHYLGAGPVFATATKSDAGAPIGLEGLRVMCEMATVPVLAIGGITAANARAVRAAGAAGVAVVSAVSDADDPVAAVRALWRAVNLAGEEIR